jgi:hypothetical protein
MIFTSILTVLFLGLSGQIYACQCASTGTIKESLASADGVIYGKVIERELVSFAETLKPDKANSIRDKIENEKRSANSFDYKQIVKIDIQVIEIFKGEITSDTVTIFTPEGGPSCGFSFELNKEYIIYGKIKSHTYSFFLNEPEKLDNIEKENCYWTNRCTRTTAFNEAELEGLKVLKKEN